MTDFPPFGDLPSQDGLLTGEVRRIQAARPLADERAFEQRMISFAACEYYNLNKYREVNYEPVCSPCYLGHEHTILQHFKNLMQKALCPVGLWVVTQDNVADYRAKEEVWWQENVPGHPWKEMYSVMPRW